jgi:hypothetical protein
MLVHLLLSATGHIKVAFLKVGIEFISMKAMLFVLIN